MIEKIKQFFSTVLIMIILLVLAGCASKPLAVQVPVPVSCVTTKPAVPMLESLSDTSKTSDGTLMLHLARDVAALKIYSENLRNIVDACSNSSR